ncbi:unnamed protein product [Hymenolepis diminuta]|uniref:Uncharacterized protein n=1 Tax=Hymenolepis diminuta TaxID=6216 RepID=A0A564Y7A1_HYMDI|nr:unnamed protein product [Hymenolepis diminuta]
MDTKKTFTINSTGQNPNNKGALTQTGGSLTPKQPVISLCRPTTRKKRSRYHPPCSTRTRWHFTRLLVDLASKTDW